MFSLVKKNMFKGTSRGYNGIKRNIGNRGGLIKSMYRSFGLDLAKMRNIGISAHIDSGKTTFTERVLYYSGKINSIHDVKGSDGVGATMDFMELEKERGITIQSAATTVTWGENTINIIDTPGHVDFTIEVERALRVLDGAVLLVCGVSGVQAQTLTVDKQMKRYNVPRVVFINKLDRMGADPWTSIDGIRSRLSLNCASLQVPIGQDSDFKGLIDIITRKAVIFEDDIGEKITEVDIPEHLVDLVEEKREELISCLAEFDEEIEMMYLEEETPSDEQIYAAIEHGTKSLQFSPVLMGSAYKNKGVQQALDCIIQYLPNPKEVLNTAFRPNPETGKEEETTIVLDDTKPFLCLAFKLEEGQYGQLTYCRVYQGKLKKGQTLINQRDGTKYKIARMAKMHANSMEEIKEVEAGDIFALFGVECASGDTIASDKMMGRTTMSSMHVPDPVISLEIKPKSKGNIDKLQGAMQKFRREDPTFHVNIDEESEEVIISGMGELHLEVYAERLKREFEIPVELGEPTVNYRETLSDTVSFNYLHKKQSGGAGQFARVIGYMEPMTEEEGEFMNIFEDKTIGTNIPNEYKTAIEKQFHDSCIKGPLTNYPVVNTRFILEDGETHVVDSSGGAFATATRMCFNQCFREDGGVLMEPVMDLEATSPMSMYQGVMADITKRGGNVYNSEPRGDLFVIEATIPLSKMFGFASTLRGMTQGQGEFSMEYKTHDAVPIEEQEEIVRRVRMAKGMNVAE